MKIVLVGGKTGGHLCPGIAICEHLVANGHDGFFLSSYNDLDKEILGEYGIPFFPIVSCAPGNSFSFSFFVFLFHLFIGVIQSLYYLIAIKPDIVVGLGGYPSVPSLISAIIKKLNKKYLSKK